MSNQDIMPATRDYLNHLQLNIQRMSQKAENLKNFSIIVNMALLGSYINALIESKLNLAFDIALFISIMSLNFLFLRNHVNFLSFERQYVEKYNDYSSLIKEKLLKEETDSNKLLINIFDLKPKLMTNCCDFINVACSWDVLPYYIITPLLYFLLKFMLSFLCL